MFFNLFGKKDGAGKEEIFVGEVIHYFGKVKAAVVKVKKEKILIGDDIKIKGHTTNIIQKVKSLQINNEQVESATKGKEVAVKLNGRARVGDMVYVLKEIKK